MTQNHSKSKSFQHLKPQSWLDPNGSNHNTTSLNTPENAPESPSQPNSESLLHIVRMHELVNIKEELRPQCSANLETLMTYLTHGWNELCSLGVTWGTPHNIHYSRLFLVRTHMTICLFAWKLPYSETNPYITRKSVISALWHTYRLKWELVGYPRSSVLQNISRNILGKSKVWVSQQLLHVVLTHTQHRLQKFQELPIITLRSAEACGNEHPFWCRTQHWTQWRSENKDEPYIA